MKFNAKFDRPVCFLKIQTTGTNPKTDRIIEIALVKKIPGEEKEITAVTKINPGIDIPESATAINGISNEDVKNAPTFEKKAQGLYDFLEGCDFVGFAIKNFDLKFLTYEFNRAGISFLTFDRNIVDILELHQRIEPRSLRFLASKYLDQDIPNQLKSTENINTSLSLFNAIIDAHKGETLDNGSVLESNVAVISQLCDNRRKNLDLEGKIFANEKGVATFNFGKYKGKPVVETLADDQQYKSWLLHSPDKIDEDVKLVLEKLLADAKQEQTA